MAEIAAAETDQHAAPESVTIMSGEGSHAHAEGKDITVVAGGENSGASAVVAADRHMASVIAARSGCVAELEDGSAEVGTLAVVAVGICGKSISNVAGTPSISIGNGNHSVARDGGTAVSINLFEESSAEAGEGGYLVSLDLSEAEPAVVVFKVDPDEGIWPDVPYTWRRGWKMPRPDIERIDREGWSRAKEFAERDARGDALADTLRFQPDPFSLAP